MRQENIIELPVIEMPVNCGTVRKSVIRDITNASSYEYEKVMNNLCRKDNEFSEKYADWRTSWSVSEELALRIITHLYPGYRVKVVLGG